MLKQELTTFCADVLSSAWDTREGTKVPDEDSRLTLKNTAIEIEGTVLYADLDGSTAMVDHYDKYFSAEIYKTYLYCCARIISSEGGTVTAYDGDRIMAVFIGERKNTRAVRAAMKIRSSVETIINPQINKHYPNRMFRLKYVVGIDTCPLFVAKTGARGANDLVWVGRAANYAAKLTSLPSTYTYITDSVYRLLAPEAKISSNGVPMWESLKWSAFNNQLIYRSSFQWTFS